MASPYTKQWKEAMNKQIGSFSTIKTWRLMPRLKDVLVLSSKWVYKIKKKLNDTILYKAWWVVREFKQIYSVNYD